MAGEFRQEVYEGHEVFFDGINGILARFTEFFWEKAEWLSLREIILRK
jgi:hypothetical protein